MVRPSAKTSLTTGVASWVMLLPVAGCARPSADLSLPTGSEPTTSNAVPCTPCASAPRPAPGSADDHEPPVIVGARFIARDRVQLTFSEPLATTEGVNPRQFRISHAYTMVDNSGDNSYASGYYYDVAGTDSYSPQLVFVQMELYEDQPEVLALILNQPVPTDLCDRLTDSQINLDQIAAEPGTARRGEVGLFLHYTSRGSDGVRDRVDNPLADVGADWALNFGSRHKSAYGSDPVMRLDLLPKLYCPDPTMTTGGPPGPS